MKIIKRISDNAVLFTGNDLSIDDYVKGNGWEARSFTSATVMVDEADLPIDYAVGGAWGYNGSWSILDQTLVDAKRAEIAAEVAKIIADKVEILWEAADTYVTGYISGLAIGLLTIGLIQAKPKALAVAVWSSAIWAAYYTRKALVTADSLDDLDFSSFGAMPHSVPELQVEVGI